MTYPTNIMSWDDREDGVSDVLAEDVNTLASEIIAIETELFDGVKSIKEVASIPTTPTNGILKLFARSRAGRLLLQMIGPSGVDTPLQPALFGNTVYMWLASATTGASIAFGTTWSARNTTGAQSHPAKTTTSLMNSMNRAIYSSTSAANTASGIQSNNTVAVRGNVAFMGGFFAFFRFGINTWSGTGQQLLVGLSAHNAVLGAEPSTLANTIALGKDSTDTTWQLIFRNASALTKIDTGVTITLGDILDLSIFCKPNDTKVTVRLVRVNDGVVLIDDVEYTEATTNLPVNTTFMYAHCHLRNTGAAVNAIALNRIYVETDI